MRVISLAYGQLSSGDQSRDLSFTNLHLKSQVSLYVNVCLFQAQFVSLNQHIVRVVVRTERAIVPFSKSKNTDFFQITLDQIDTVFGFILDDEFEPTLLL